MTPEEVTHFSVLIADLVVAGIRCRDNVAQLAEVRAELVDTVEQALTLLAHDAPPSATVLSLRPDWAADPRQWSVKA